MIPDDLQKQLQDDIAATLNLTVPKSKYQIKWLDTKTGKVDKTESVDHPGGTLKLASPKFDNDITLLLTRAE